jgi:hypothetical protein
MGNNDGPHVRGNSFAHGAGDPAWQRLNWEYATLVRPAETTSWAVQP